MFELKKTEGKARRGEFTCAHGTVQTPVFMNVGTQAAIKGGLSAEDLKNIGCQVELSNTYHLHLRPTDKVVRQMGGLHKFMTWDGPILTDSGGFQVFSLSALRKIKEEGVYFSSHIDGHKIFMGPEESMQIQSNLGSDICMAFDECIENPAPRKYVLDSTARTVRWLERCKAENARLNSLPDTVNPQQMLWGINQGGTYADIRVEHIEHGKLIDVQVKYNPDYNPAPGRRIERITFRNIRCDCMPPVESVIAGYDAEHDVRDIRMENVLVCGQAFQPQIGQHVSGMEMLEIGN